MRVLVVPIWLSTIRRLIGDEVVSRVHQVQAVRKNELHFATFVAYNRTNWSASSRMSFGVVSIAFHATLMSAQLPSVQRQWGASVFKSARIASRKSLEPSRRARILSIRKPIASIPAE